MWGYHDFSRNVRQGDSIIILCPHAVMYDISGEYIIIIIIISIIIIITLQPLVGPWPLFSVS
jgi:hypothetical protein